MDVYTYTEMYTHTVIKIIASCVLEYIHLFLRPFLTLGNSSGICRVAEHEVVSTRPSSTPDFLLTPSLDTRQPRDL